MKISFCTTCMGRTDHLKKTLPANIKNNLNQDVEFVIVDYNSHDGMEAWAKIALAQYIKTGKVVYIAERTAKYFERCHAKNIAHLMASGDVLVNIDADNYTGPGYAKVISDVFADNDIILTSSSTKYDIAGKIGISAMKFKALRGYDEALHGYGMEDVDLVERAKNIGLKNIIISHHGEDSIEHSHKLRTKNLNGSGIFKSMNINREIILSRKNVKVNVDGWARATIYKNFSNNPVNIGIETVKQHGYKY